MKRLTNIELKTYIEEKENLVIYGAGILGQGLYCLLKELNLDKKVIGFMVSDHTDHMNEFMGVPIKCISEYDISQLRILIAVKERYLCQIQENVKDALDSIYVSVETLKQMFLQTEQTHIADELKQKINSVELTDEQYVTFFIRQIRRTKLDFEINIVDHCNLNCKCCNHFSPLASPCFLSLEEFEKDMKRIAELTNGNVGRIWLIGGEPLLHPNLVQFLYSARKFFPNTHITLNTNGTLLLKQSSEFWGGVRENKIELTLTKYPISIDYKLIDKKMQLENVKYSYTLSSLVLKTTYHLPLAENSELDSCKNYMQCWHANECITVRNGRVYTCPIAAHAHYFNEYFNKNLYVGDENSIGLYEIETEKELLEFLKKPIPFCKYCNIAGYTYDLEWGISKREISEWT